MRIGVNSNCPRCGKMTRSGYCRDCAEMSRLEEVNKTLRREATENVSIETHHSLARTLTTELDNCAAGPWRYDVENALMETFYWCYYGEDDYEVCKMNFMHQWRNAMNAYMPPPRAIAAINTPEVPK